MTGYDRDTASRSRRAAAGRDDAEVRVTAGFRNPAEQYYRFFRQNDLVRTATRSRRCFFCGRALTVAAVAANGDIYPCNRFVGAPSYRMGNVNTGEFSRDAFPRSLVAENPECGSCWARYLCGGYCQHDNAAATGDPMRPDPHSCVDLRARIECAIHAVDCLGKEERDWLAGPGIIEGLECQVDI